MSAHRILDIYVAPDCVGCQTAQHLAATVRALALPGVEVRLIDLTEWRAARPEAVFAVPTYLLDGRVLSLGNPEQDWLIDRLRAAPDERAESTSGGGA
jgi:hypothetical protein